MNAVLLKIGADKRPKVYRAFQYGPMVTLYAFGQPVAQVTPEQAQRGREAYDAECRRWQKEGA